MYAFRTVFTYYSSKGKWSHQDQGKEEVKAEKAPLAI